MSTPIEAAFLLDWWARDVALRAAVLRHRPEFFARATSPDPATAGAFFAVDTLERGKR